MEPTTASTQPTAAEEFVPPSPPPTPPRITFNPPLYLQRRTTVHAILRQISASPRFSGKLRSVLDVGCGTDPLLLKSLIPCEDDLPLERITGIDFDDEIFHPGVAESVAPGSFGGTGEAEDRWRRLDVSLLQGSFVHLTPKTVPRHDIIVSTEVIEHLDPMPLAQYAPVLLGKMRPKICVITTPNRDFNKVFDIPFTPLDHTPLTHPVIEKDELPNIDSIIENSFDQPKPHSDLGKGLVGVLEAAATQFSDKTAAEIEFVLEEIPKQPTSSISVPTEDDCIPGDSEKRFWRAGVPYPMRHPDHRFEWTRAEFREWAKTSAEQFGYDVVFTGVGGLDCGMSIAGGTGWAIQKSLEDAANLSLGDIRDELSGIDLGDDIILGDGFENPAGFELEGMGALARKAKVVFGDCSQIAVFVIKESTEAEWESVEGFPTTPNTAPDLRPRAGSRSEGTAEPIFSWTPLITPDTWFAAPFFTAPDIRLVCHYSYPFLANEEYPPSYISMLGMVQDTFINFLPPLVFEEWRKTPAVLAREERERKEGILYKPIKESVYIDPFDLFQPPTPEVLEERKQARKEIDEREKHRLEEQMEIMGDMKVEDVQVVKVVIGARKVWDSSYRLQRAFRFHYDVFRQLFAELGDKGVMEFADATSYDWKTIIDTTGTIDHSAEKMVVELTTTWVHDFVKMTTNPPEIANSPYYDEYSMSDGIHPGGSNSGDKCQKAALIEHQSKNQHLLLEMASDHPNEETFWDSWDDSGDSISVDDFVHHEGDNGNDYNGNWYHNDVEADAEAGILGSQSLKVHSVSVWGLINKSSPIEPSIKGKGKMKNNENDNHRGFVSHQEIQARLDLDLEEQEGVLRVGRNGKPFRGEEAEATIEWQEGDIPIAITYYKPRRIINYDSGIGEGSYGVQDGATEEIEDDAGAQNSSWNSEDEGVCTSLSECESKRQGDLEGW